MDTQKEFDKIKQLLDNAEGWENISKETRKIVQERFQLLLIHTEQLQEENKQLKRGLRTVQARCSQDINVITRAIYEIADDSLKGKL